MDKPIIVTMGDPSGIGPELIVKALVEGAFTNLSHPLLIAGDAGALQRAAGLFGASVTVAAAGEESLLTIADQQLAVRVLSSLPAGQMAYGRPGPAAGQAMADYVEWAVQICRSGNAAAMVTCPINKAAIHAAGIGFPGHTELLAERCGCDKVVMMLAGERLKVCLVTTHLAYRDVPDLLSEADILATLTIVDQALRRDFGFARPRLGVLALNPHAGEGGLFGAEEQTLIAPAIARAQAAGIAASGPHSADSFFHFAVQGGADAVVCMYHDQGLIPLKLLHFDDAVNVTLGLPIVRTSVDHGTAYDLAGTGRASTASLIAALRLADRMAAAAGCPVKVPHDQ